MKNIHTILKRFKFYLHKKLKRRRVLKKLERIDVDTLKSVAFALRDVINLNITKEEKFWIEKIEKLRRKLNTLTMQIIIEDYGAGAPDINLTEDDIHKGRILKKTIGEAVKGSVSYIKGLTLFKLARELKPSICLELGTALGISSSYIAAALELNSIGNLITIEGAKSVAEIARENFKKLGLSRIYSEIGRFQDILELVINEDKPIDFVFIDGHHDEYATLNYFETIFPSLSDNAILVFDDIRWSKGMKRAWKTLIDDVRFKYTIDLFEIGICIISNSNNKKESFKSFLK